MKIERTIASVLATVMVMNMLILAAALVPAGEPSTQTAQRQSHHAQVQQAGLFGCFWACLKCVGSFGTSGKACRKCAGCLGDDSADEPATDR